jgi:hypothetical protein
VYNSEILNRRLLSITILGVALFLVAGPAFGVDTSDHAADQIRAIVTAAEKDIDRVVATFDDDISSLETQAEVSSAESDAKGALEGIWTTAKAAIEDIVKLYPGELGILGGEAKQQIQDARLAARSQITDLAEAWSPPAPTTTTTTTAPTTTTTTTTTTPTTTTTTTASEGQPDRAPANPSNNGNGSGPSGTPERVIPFASTPPSEDPVSDSIEFSIRWTPNEPVAFGFEPDGETSEARGSGATDRMARLLDTVLPPAVVDLVLSPLLILEILIRTVLDGGTTMIGPLLILAACAYAIFKYERSAKRHPVADSV